MKFSLLVLLNIFFFWNTFHLMANEPRKGDMSKKAMTIEDYCKFLNAMTPVFLEELCSGGTEWKSDVSGITFNDFYDEERAPQVIRSGKPGSYSYEVVSESGGNTTSSKMLLFLMNWKELACYCDWSNSYLLISKEVACVDRSLKSNKLTFYMVHEPIAFQAGGENIVESEGLGETVGELIASALLLTGSETVKPSEKERSSPLSPLLERVISERDDVAAKEMRGYGSKARLEELTHTLIGRIYQRHHEMYDFLSAPLYKEADQYWKKATVAWKRLIKAQYTKQDKIIRLNEAKALLQKIQEIKKDTQETFLKRVANVVGRAAIPLNYVPRPLPIGGIAYMEEDEVVKKIDEIWHDLDEDKANFEILKAVKELKVANQELDQAAHHLDTINKQAREREDIARAATFIVRRTAAEATYPPLRSFDQCSWESWAKRLIQEGGESEQWIVPLMEQAVIDPVWAATTILAAWEKSAQQKHALIPETIAFSAQRAEAMRKAKELHAQAKARTTEAQQEISQIQEDLRHSEVFYKKITQELEEQHVTLNNLEKAYGENDNVQLSANRTTFLRKLEYLKESYDIINDQQKSLALLLNKQIAALLARCEYSVQKKVWKNQQERFDANVENPMLAATPFRLSRYHYEPLSPENPTHSDLSNQPPLLLDRVVELLSVQERAQQPLEKNFFLPEIKNPAKNDRARWESRKKIEQLLQEKERIIASCSQEDQKKSPLLLGTFLSHTAGVLTSITKGSWSERVPNNEQYATVEQPQVSLLASHENNTARTRSKSASDSNSFVAAIHGRLRSLSFSEQLSHRTFPEKRRVGRSKSSDSEVTASFKTTQSRQRSDSIKQQHLEAIGYALTQAQKKLQEQIQEAETKRLTQGGKPYLDVVTCFEAWKKADELAQERLQEKERIAIGLQGVTEHLKDWAENTQRWEARWKADHEKDVASAQHWNIMAEKKIQPLLSVKAAPDFTERFILEKEKLQERDQAINILWQDLQPLYKKATQDQLIRHISSLRSAPEGPHRNGYKFDLDMIRKSIATYFASADGTLDCRDHQAAADAEKKALANYAKQARIKALEDAVKKAPGAQTVWEYRIHQAKKEYQTAQKKAEQDATPFTQQMVQQKAALLQYDQEAQQLFEEADREYNELEKIWLLQLQQETRSSHIATWSAVKDYMETQDRRAWDLLPNSEKSHYNNSVLEANYIRYQQTIHQLQTLLKEAHESIQEAENVMNALFFVTIKNKSVRVSAKLKFAVLEQAINKSKNLTTYLTQLITQQTHRAAWYNRCGRQFMTDIALEQKQKEIEKQAEEINNKLPTLKLSCYLTQEKKLKTEIAQLEEKAKKVEGLTIAAESKAKAAPVGEASSLWDEVSAKYYEAVDAWDETLQFYKKCLELVPADREALTRISYGNPAATCESLMDTASVSQCSSGGMRNTTVVAMHHLPFLHEDAQRLATNYDEISKLKTNWKKEMESIEDKKNRASASALYYRARKVHTLTIAAESKAKAAPVAEASSLWDEAIAKDHEEVAAWDKTLEFYKSRIGEIPIHRADLKTYWERNIERIEYLKNEASSWAFFYRAKKASSLAIVIENQARAENGINSNYLWDEVIKKCNEAVDAWDEALQSLKAVPVHCDYIKEFWQERIERIENNKRRASVLVHFCESSKVNKLILIAENEAQAASAAEASFLWDTAITKRNKEKEAWNQALQSIKAISMRHDETRESREDEMETIEEIEENKNRASALALCCQVMKVVNLAAAAESRAFDALPAEASSLWNEVIVKGHEEVKARNELHQSYKEFLKAVPANRDDFKEWWEKEMASIEDKKNRASAWVLCCKARKESSLVIAAESKAQAVPAAEASSLWDEVIAKSHEEVKAWDEALQSYKEFLKVVPANYDDFKEWWKEEMEIIKEDQNRASALAVSYVAQKASSLAIAAENKAKAVSAGTEASFLCDEAITKGYEEIKAWDETLQSYKEFLKVVPVHRSELKDWWEGQIKDLEQYQATALEMVAQLKARRARAHEALEAFKSKEAREE